MRRVLFIALFAAGCGPGPDDGDDGLKPPPSGAVTLGLRADAGFVPLEDGADLFLEAGAQGGFHVSLTAQVEGFEEVEQVEIERETRRADTGELVARTRFVSEIGETGALKRELPVFLCPAPIGISVADEALSVRLSINGDGGTAEATVTFFPHCPENETEAFCDEICRR